MRRATGATLLREATSEFANSDDSAAFAELSALSSMCGCPRTMRCASCARDYTHGAELRAGGPQERPFCARRPPSSPTLTTAQLSLSSQSTLQHVRLPEDHAMRELCARLHARRRAACGRASATVPARDGSRVPFLPSMAAAPLSLASTESSHLGPHRRAARCCGRGSLLQRGVKGVRCIQQALARLTPCVSE